jgi:transposase InsO family protein
MGLVEGVRKTLYYTYGHRTVVHTDHKPLIYLMAKNTTHPQLARWLIELQQYENVEYKHIKGTQNTLADALSRLEKLTVESTDQELEDAISGPFGLATDDVQCNTLWTLRTDKTADQLQREDSVLGQAIKAIESTIDPSQIKDPEIRWYVEKCVLDDKGTLVLKPRDNPLPTDRRKIVVPKALRRDVFRQFHSSMIGGGHTDARRTMDKMQDYCWRGMSKDVADWHKRCFQFQIRAPKRHKVPLVMTILKKPFQSMGLDTCGPLHTTPDGSNHYLLCIDRFTKYISTIAIPDLKTMTIVRALWDQVILKFGIPEEILTDNARTFTSHLFVEFMTGLGIRLEHSTPHDSDGNAITERAFRTFHDIISKFRADQDPEKEFLDWDKWLQIATFAYNVTPHSTTGESPFMLMFGRDPMFPMELIFHDRKSPKEPPTIKEFRAELVKTVEALRARAIESFEHAAERMKAQADKRCKDTDIKEGELVLFRDYSLRVGISSKYKNPWHDVYRVRKIQDQHAYIVPSTRPNDEPKRVHLNQVKRFYCDEEVETMPISDKDCFRVPEPNKPVPKKDYKQRKEERTQAFKLLADAAKQKPRRRGEGTKYNLRQFTKTDGGSDAAKD